MASCQNLGMLFAQENNACPCLQAGANYLDICFCWFFICFIAFRSHSDYFRPCSTLAHTLWRTPWRTPGAHPRLDPKKNGIGGRPYKKALERSW